MNEQEFLEKLKAECYEEPTVSTDDYDLGHNAGFQGGIERGFNEALTFFKRKQCDLIALPEIPGQTIWKIPLENTMAPKPDVSDLAQAAADFIECPMIKEYPAGRVCLKSILALEKLKQALTKLEGNS